MTNDEIFAEYREDDIQPVPPCPDDVVVIGEGAGDYKLTFSSGFIATSFGDSPAEAIFRAPHEKWNPASIVVKCEKIE